MYTQCPHCQTTFRIADAHLKAAKGMVRCGSCQSIFDARAHLSHGVPEDSAPEKPKPASPVAKPAPVPEPPPVPKPAPQVPETPAFEEDEFEHIDLSAVPDRSNAPDQSGFMESIFEENSPYNNLDEMGKISIPGDINPTDSFVGLPPKSEDLEIQEPEETNPYADTESTELPASTSERSAINELYLSAENQINNDEQLANNIEELLSYASSLDEEKDPSDISRLDMKPDLADLESFESELDNIELMPPEQEDTAAVAPEPKPEPEPERTSKPETRSKTKPDSESARSRETEPAVELELEENELPSPEFDIPKALRSSFEKFDAPKRPIGLSIAMVLLILVLFGGFLFQLIFFRSYELANQIPQLAPVLTDICQSLPCRYSGSMDVTKIELQSRDVRSHPSQKNALLISAAFINQADYHQPYPTIAIRLSDLSGHVVAMRHFRPEEYLDKMYSKFLLMEPGTPVHITLAVLDPGDDAINFDFSFL